MTDTTTNSSPKVVVADTVLDITECSVFRLYLDMFDITQFCDTILDILRIDDEFGIQLTCFRSDLFNIYYEIYGDEIYINPIKGSYVENAINEMAMILKTLHRQLISLYDSENSVLPYDTFWIQTHNRIGIIRLDDYQKQIRDRFMRYMTDTHSHVIKRTPPNTY